MFWRGNRCIADLETWHCKSGSFLNGVTGIRKRAC